MKALFLAKPLFCISKTDDNGDIGNLISILKSFDEVLTEERLAVALEPYGVRTVLLKGSSNSYVRRISDLVAEALGKGAGVCITAGGDGIASYVASDVIKLVPEPDERPLLIGYPCGTVNAGPIVQKLETDTYSRLKPVKLDAIEVTDGTEILGYGFNDVIIGNTFLGTEDGQIRNFSAKIMAEEGISVAAAVSDNITGKNFSAKLNGEVLKTTERICLICVSPMQFDKTASRVVLGGLTNAGYMKHAGGAAFTDRNLMDCNPASFGYRGAITTSHVVFDENDELVLSGFGEDAQIIIDGNPFERKTDQVRFRIVPEAVTALWSR